MKNKEILYVEDFPVYIGECLAIIIDFIEDFR